MDGVAGVSHPYMGDGAGLLKPEETAGICKPLPEARFLPKRIYADPDVFLEEKRRIFWKEWIPVGVLDKVRNPGDFFSIDILGQPLMVVCDQDHKIRTFFRVCAHRAMIITEGEGNAKRFQCPYHHWTYNLQGKLISAPQMQKAARENKDCIGLKEVVTEVWQGIIMINFDGKAEPLSQRLAELDHILNPLKISEMFVPLERKYPGDWNWKIMIENGDAYHVLAIHENSAQERIPAENTVMEPRDGQPFTMYHMYYSQGHAPKRREECDSEADKAAYIDNVANEYYERLTFYFVWPCLAISVTPEQVVTYITTPLDIDTCLYTWRLHLPSGAKAHPRLEERIDDARQSFDTIHGEDVIPCAGVKRGYASEGWQTTAMSHLDEAVWQFQRWYARRMASEPILTET